MSQFYKQAKRVSNKPERLMKTTHVYVNMITGSVPRTIHVETCYTQVDNQFMTNKDRCIRQTDTQTY